MNKRRIRLIIAMIGLALLGLLAVQFYWVNNALTLQERQFSQNVNDALSETVRKVEKVEAAGILAGSLSRADSLHTELFPGSDIQVVQKHGSMKLEANIRLNDNNYSRSVKQKIVIGGNKSRDLSSPDLKIFREFFSNSFSGDSSVNPASEQSFRLFFDSIESKMENNASMVNSIVMEMTLGRKRSQERVNPAVIDSILKQELKNRGITTSYAFGIYDNRIRRVLVASDPGTHEALGTSPYKTLLFPGNIYSAPEYLSVFFPEKKNFLLQQTGGAISVSVLFILIIMASFAYTLHIIYRQKKLSDMKTDFINNMTHEFKTPVSTILLASEALKDPSVAGDTDRMRRLAGVIYDENQRIGNQVERVLQLARMEKGDFKINFTEADVHTLIRKAVESISIQAESKGGKIHLSLDAMQPVVMGDALHLTNVILNLLDNAIKYCSTAPVIGIATRNTHTGVEIIVEDNGIGMTRDQLSRIFEKFYRVPTGNLHDVKGFGLGLSYVKTIVEMHGGDITVKSEKNNGSRFSLFLPFQKPDKS